MAKMLDGMEAMLRGEAPPPAAATLLGMRLASFSAGEALVELDATAAHGDPMGTVQGGVLAAVADAAMGWAYMTTLGEGRLHDRRDEGELPQAVRTGRISARAKVKNAGRTLGLIECDVLDSGDKLVAHAVSTCMILRAASDGR
jgi:uncharacterized protein (TIGR00369 family)